MISLSKVAMHGRADGITGRTLDTVSGFAGKGGLFPEVPPRALLEHHLLQSVVAEVALHKLVTISRMPRESGAVGHLAVVTWICDVKKCYSVV